MTDSQSSTSRPKVIILGAVLAGLNAAKTLGCANVDVTIVDRNNHHTFHPLLYQSRSRGVKPGDIAQPIRSHPQQSQECRSAHGGSLSD